MREGVLGSIRYAVGPVTYYSYVGLASGGYLYLEVWFNVTLAVATSGPKNPGMTSGLERLFLGFSYLF